MGAYAVNGLNQYTCVGATNANDCTGGKVPAYDNNSNLTNDGHGTTFGYDTENRLISASGAKSATLKYDPKGRLFEITSAGITTQFLYDGDALVAEYTGAGITNRYVHGSRVDEPYLWYAGSAVNAYIRSNLHSDHQGSIIGVSNSTADSIGINKYDVYGIPETTNIGRFSYTGQIYLPEVGLHYYKARIYSAKLGRFLQTDPVGYKDQMNLYAYVGNDPMNMTDPTGKYGRGSGFTDDQWKKFDSAQKAAATEMTKAASTLKQTAADMRAGKDVGAPKGAEGASAKDMDKMASKLDAGAKALNDNGTLGYVASQGKTSSGAFGEAAIGGKTIRVDASHSAFGNNRNTAFMAGHESLHNAGLVDQKWAGWTAYRSSGDSWERKAYEKLSAEQRSENPDHIMSIVYP